ncbi:unnamed protein product [Rotaria sp. Silwood2]|nr:unnamed protein product [Rotaria sp. Silwood2]CAF2906976.1 unnamed protein product [Rotaria sp. Silwood2]CAF4466944.1 unnamed protein product [Rotaria sp. Silwood2]
MVNILRLPETRSDEGQDNFFHWSMVILPILAEAAYVFDASYYLTHHSNNNGYEGLCSTILIVFAYLRYCSPIENRVSLFIYYILLCLLSETGTIVYLITFIIKKDLFSTIDYILWSLLELIFTIMLIYCRIIKKYQINFIVENKHLFHFMSRLEIILAVFLPFFVSKNFTSLTQNSIAFFLLFDFFSDSYVRFRGVWIKFALYLFVTTVTLTVATEWLYFATKIHFYEQISAISELVSAYLCVLLIILQFFPHHFTPTNIIKISREGFTFQQNFNMDTIIKDEYQNTTREKLDKIVTTIDSYC